MADNSDSTSNEADSPVDLDAALANLDASQLAGFEMVINPDGTVTFVDFPPELLDIALALNPDDPLVCERMSARTSGAEDADADKGCGADSEPTSSDAT